MRKPLLSLVALGLLLTTGCTKKGEDGTTPPPADDAAKPTEPAPPGTGADRPALTNAECQAKGGTVVGDIGDGAIHRPEYRCANGEPPMGSIRAEGDAPVAIEGAVCCPADAG